LVLAGGLALAAAPGCAAVQSRIDTACEYVTIIDDRTSEAFGAAGRYGVSTEYVEKYMVPVGRVVVEAHDWCFEDPGDAR
jgi:hypothetical protein